MSELARSLCRFFRTHMIPTSSLLPTSLQIQAVGLAKPCISSFLMSFLISFPYPHASFWDNKKGKREREDKSELDKGRIPRNRKELT